MNRKRLIKAGLFAAAVALLLGVSHCLRAMRNHGGVGQRHSSETCRPADCMRRRDHDRAQEAAALAA